MKYQSAFVTTWVLLVLASPSLFAQETVTAAAGPLKLQVNIPGVFVADDKSEIRMEPGEYEGDLIVTRILPEGVNVRPGDVLMEFDSDMLDEAIEEARNEATDAEVELKKAIAEYESAKIDMTASQSRLKTEQTFLEREVQAAVARQVLDLAQNEQGVVDAEYRLANARIDFDTLRKIYQERDLSTSRSGDILMQRERKKVENAEKQIEFLKRKLEYFKQFDKSKEQLEKELALEKKRAEIRKEKVNLEAAVAEKASAVEKARRKFDAASEKVSGLHQDRDQLRVVSPREGVLFYGTTGNEMPAGVVVIGGRTGNVRDELRIGGRVKTHSILLTVATMENLSIKMSIAEDDIQHLKKDLEITVFPNAFPAEQFAGVLTRVDQIATKTGFSPNSPRRFKVMGKCTDKAPELRSGMNCRVAVHVESAAAAILIPVTGVFEEEGQLVCYVRGADGTQRREVAVGYSNARLVQITSGLQAGEEVFLAKPDFNPDATPDATPDS